jgi:hypothetical protein
VRHFETVVARLDGSVVEEVTLTLVHLTEDSDLGEDGELPALRVPERPAAAADEAEEPAAPADAPVEAPAAMHADSQPIEELAAPSEDA